MRFSKLLQRRNLRIDVLAREIFELRVVLVIARQRPAAWADRESKPDRSIHRKPSRNLLLPVSLSPRGQRSRQAYRLQVQAVATSFFTFPLMVRVRGSMRLPALAQDWQAIRESRAELRRAARQPSGYFSTPCGVNCAPRLALRATSRIRCCGSTAAFSVKRICSSPRLRSICAMPMRSHSSRSSGRFKQVDGGIGQRAVAVFHLRAQLGDGRFAARRRQSSCRAAGAGSLPAHSSRRCAARCRD